MPAEDGSPLVSVVICTNRLSPYLADAVDSVLAQSLSDWELIVVTSGDAPVVEITAIVHDRVPAAQIVHHPAPGLSLARNTGTALAAGAFVTFLDDDDVWHPDRNERLVAQLRREPDAALCYSAGWTIDGAGEVVDRSWLPTGVDPDELLTGRVDIPRIVTMLFRTAGLIRLGGFHPAFRLAEDDELILRALQFAPLTSVPDALTGYRQHDANVTRQRTAARSTASERVITLQRWGAQARDDDVALGALTTNLERFRSRTAADHTSSAMAAARRGRWAPAAQDLRIALSTSPLGTLRAGWSKAANWARPRS